MVRNAMIQELVGRAVIDGHFRNVLMYNVRSIAEEFLLTSAEVDMIESVKADSFTLFTAELDCLVNGGKNEFESEKINGSFREPFDKREPVPGLHGDIPVESNSQHDVPRRLSAGV